MTDMDDLGWGGDHHEKLLRLQTAVKQLGEGSKVKDRFDKATFCLTGYLERDFPEHLRSAFTRIMDARVRAREDISSTDAIFVFDKPTDNRQIVKDLICLLVACSIDLGRKWSPDRDHMYPKSEILPRRKGRRSGRLDGL
jgi:hypothetical protein